MNNPTFVPTEAPQADHRSFGPGPLAVAYLAGEVSSTVALCWEALSVVDPCALGGRIELREAAYEAAASVMAASVEASLAAGAVPTWAVVAEALDGAVVASFDELPAQGRRARVVGRVLFELQEWHAR